MWRITNPLRNLGRLLRELARRAGAALDWLGRYWLEALPIMWLAVVLGYGLLGPDRVRLLEVGDTTITAPAWVVALLVSLLFAVVFALVVSQIEDE